jgi:predicted nucleotidyltransferase
MERNIILEARTGSVAYGLNHAKSDLDSMGIFLAPTSEIAGLYWGAAKESWSNASPDGDDVSYHELGKFLRLSLKSNPTLIELYFMKDYLQINEIGESMLDLKDDILYTYDDGKKSHGIRSAYYNYAKSQIERVATDYPNHKPKMARHALRLTRQGIELLTTGETSVRVENPEQYFDLQHMHFDDMMDILRGELDRLDRIDSILPEEPNVKAVSDWLIDIRRANI